MSKTTRTEERYFRSLDEFRQTFFPVSYKERAWDKQQRGPREYGASLAAAVLEDIRGRLAKSS